MPTLPDVHLRGTRAQQPAATTVSVGALYFVTDEGKTERSSGSIWEPYGPNAVLFADDASQLVMPTLEERVETLEQLVQQLIDPTARTKKKK